MGAIMRLLLATGIGAIMFPLLMILADGGLNFFADGFFSLMGFAALTLWIFDYMTYLMAT